MHIQSIKDKVYEGILNDILDGVYDVTSVIKEKDMFNFHRDIFRSGLETLMYSDFDTRSVMVVAVHE